MCEILTGQEMTLELPSSIVKRKSGFSIDIGGSLIKMVYCIDGDDVITFHFVTFTISRLEEALNYLKEKTASFRKPGQTVYTAGLGCSKQQAIIEETLDFKMLNMMETDCFIDGLLFMLKHVPAKDLLYPKSDKVEQYSRSIQASFAKAQHTWTTTFKDSCRAPMWEASKRFIANQNASSEGDPSKDITSEIAGNEKVKVQFPILMALCGSATCPLKVEEDGTYLFLDVMGTGGKTLLGLGGLLTGAQSFEELTTLAQDGSYENLDMIGKFMMSENPDIYSALSPELTSFTMGHAVGRQLGDFSREDLAAGTISLITQNMSLSFLLWSLITGVKQLFFVGGVPHSSQIIRDDIGKYFAYRSLMNPVGTEVSHYFVKFGVFLGAFGALLKNLNS